MARTKSNLIKVLTAVIAICLSLFFVLLPKAQVEADVDSTVAIFNLTKGASIRMPSGVDEIVNGEEKRYKGLRFSTQVNDLWFTQNPAEEYVFGTLIFPEDNGSVNPNWDEYDNVNELQAVRIVADTEEVKANRNYTASIVYDHATVKKLAISSKLLKADDPDIDEKTEKLLDGLYSLRLTAVSYVKKDGVITYTDSYTTSITEVSVRLLSNPEWVDKVAEYVALESVVEDGYVLVSDGSVGNYTVGDIKEVFLNGKSVEYEISNQTLVIPSLAGDETGNEYEIIVLDASNNAVLVYAVSADVAISTAEQFIAIFDEDDYDASKTYPIENSDYYVLADDINLEDYIIDNTADNGSIKLTGTFNGLGNTIYNATVDMNKASSKPTQGIFGTIAGTLTNVGFINLNGTASAGVDVGLTAPLARVLSGKLENVYVGLNPNNYNNRGPIGYYETNSSLKDVVIDFPQAEGYVFDDAMYETVAMSTLTYAYGYGALGYSIGNLRKGNVENVYVISPMPVNYAFGSGGSAYYDSDSLNQDFFFYGENETDVWFNYTYFKNNGITNPTVENTKGDKGASKTVVMQGIRRYDNISEMASDVSSKNLENVDRFLKLKGWNKSSSGQLLWGDQKQTVIINKDVDYDASTGELLTSAIDFSKVVKVTVGDEVLTRLNGGLVPSGNVYGIRAKKSINDVDPGVPYIDNSIISSNVILMTVETEDCVYKLTKVNYWTNILYDGNQVQKALDIPSSVGFNYGFYKLGNDVDMAGITYTYDGWKIPNQTFQYGFGGVFDGAKHSIINAKPGNYGLFGTFNASTNIVVKNLALIDFTATGAPYPSYMRGSVLAVVSASSKLKIENLYVSYKDSSRTYGLITTWYGKATMNNVLIDADENTVAPGYNNAGNNYGLSADVYGEDALTNVVKHEGSFPSSTWGGTLFTNARWINSGNITTSNINNVISLGKAPILYQYAYGTTLSSFVMYDTATSSWVLRNLGAQTSNLNNFNSNYEVYFGFAGNKKYGDVPIMTGLKEGFKAICGTSVATLVGYVCETCGETFSLTAGTCETCKKDLTKYNDLWSTPWSYTWKLLDTETYSNPSASGKSTYVFPGVSKYSTVGEMTDAYDKDNTIFDSFLGEAGQDCWGVNSSGKLVWKNSVTKDISVKVNDQVTNEIDVKVGENAIVEVYNGQTQLDFSMVASNDAVTVVGSVAIASKVGATELTVTYEINGINFTETVFVNVTHNYGELIDGVSSTCTENGTISHYKCSCCDKYFDENFVEVYDITVIASHDYGDWSYGGDGAHYKVCKNDNTHVVMEICSGGEATCLDDAICTVCNGIYEQALGHTGGVATCEEWGKCTRCQVDYVAPIGHNYSDMVIVDEYLATSANCLDKAVYYYACANCQGANENLTYEYGEALGHTGGLADCSELAICARCKVPYGDFAEHNYEDKYDGDYHWQECTVCHGIVNKTTHSYGAGVVTRDPTCAVLGVTSYHCDCGYVKNEDIAMLEHVFGTFNDEVPATCEQAGMKAHYQCVNCLQYFDEDEDLIKDVSLPKAHVFRTYNQPIEPLCDVTGRIGFYNCEVCNKFFKFDQVTELKESELSVPATEHADKSTGRCPCGENYADDEFFLEYFEFIYVGHKLPEEKDLDKNGDTTYSWGYALNRFYGDKPGAPVHVKVPATYNNRPVYSIASYVFNTTSNESSCTPGASTHVNCSAGSCEILYYYPKDSHIEQGVNSSPTDGNPKAVAIQSIIIADGIRMIGSAAFVGSEIRELVIPNSVVGGRHEKKQKIAEGAVYNKDIYDYPLNNICGGCNLLEKVVIGSGVEVVGSYSFYGLKSLRDVKFEVEEIKNDDGTTTLKGVREIRFRAFGDSEVAIDPTMPDLSRPKFVIPETLVSLPEGDIYSNAANQTVRLYRLHMTDMNYYLNITKEQYESMIIPAKKRDEYGNIINAEDKYRTTYGYTEGWCGTSFLYFKGEWEYNESGIPVAYEELAEREVAYDYSDGTYKMLNSGAIVGLTESGQKLDILNIPATINGVKITRIAPNAFKYSKATSVVLSENITKLDSYAFRLMYNLTSVVGTSKISKVGKDLFRDSTNIRSVVLLSNNSNVSDIVIAGSNKIASMSEKLGEFSISISGNNYLFTNDETTYTLDSNGYVYNTENVLFGYFGTEKEITVYDNIVEIADGAFENSQINKINLPAGLKKIGDNAFRNSEIISIDVPAGVTEIGEGAFAHTNIKKFVMPSGVTKISASAFAECKLLREFIFNDVVTEIDDGAFSGCSKLYEMIIPSGVTRIGENAFLGAERLAVIYIPKTVESIGGYAFSYCNDIVAFEYEGTRADWNLMIIDRNWNYVTEEFDVIFADGVGGYLDIQESMSIVINQTKAIPYNIQGLLVWESSNEDVAVVDNKGRVTAIDVGQTVITVKSGNKYGKCVVTVGYGDYMPKFVIENGIQDGDLLEVGNNYKFYSYVTFNNKDFYDFNVSCVSSNNAVAYAVYDQNSKAITVNAVSTGRVTITLNAMWREYTSNNAFLLTQTFTVDVIGDVDFYINGDIPRNVNVLAPTKYSNEADSIVNFVPTVVIDGVTHTPNVTIDYLGNASASHLVYDRENSRILGYKVSKAKAMLRYTHGGIEMGVDVLIEVLPNEVTLTDTYLFSADDGMLMIENASGVYEAVTVTELLNDTVLVANEGNSELFVDGDGSILGFSYKPVSYKHSELVAITDYARYTIPVQVAKRYIDSADDLLEVLNVKENVADVGATIEGMFALVKDLDMTGYKAYNFVSYETNTADDISAARQADKFEGSFDGRGYKISNLTINMYKGSKTINQGLFGCVGENSTIENVAFENFTGYSRSDVGLTSPLGYIFNGTMQNVYVEVSPETCNFRGAFNQISKSATLDNVVISFKVGVEFDYATVAKDSTWKAAWGYGSLAQSVSASATYNNVYVITSIPLYYGTSGGGEDHYDNELLTKDNFIYGENETEFWFNHTVNAGKTFEEVIVDLGSGVNSKAYRLNGVRRYDNVSDMCNDKSELNLEKIQELIDSGYWKLVDGLLVWA